MRLTRGRLTMAVAGAGAALLGWWWLRPAAVAVDTAIVVRGPLVTTIDEDGETDIPDHVELAAPVAGRLETPRVREGDSVSAGAVVAVLHALPLDPRTREAAEAHLRAAEAGAQEADARVAQARAARDEARRALSRADRLTSAGQLAPKDLEAAQTEATVRERELEAAGFRARAAAFDARSARAALAGDATATVSLRAPARGVVLRLIVEHERVVAAGTPLLELGDPRHLEVVVDVVTEDAIGIPPGASVRVTAGGADTLDARVHRVEPSAFTRVSPLGVEEQRVRVHADFPRPPPGLGDHFRVHARIVTWSGAGVISVPASALFRQGASWAAWVVRAGRARPAAVEIGHRGTNAVEIDRGLNPGDTVIVHPPEGVRDGARVVPMRN